MAANNRFGSHAATTAGKEPLTEKEVEKVENKT